MHVRVFSLFLKNALGGITGLEAVFLTATESITHNRESLVSFDAFRIQECECLYLESSQSVHCLIG